MNKLERLQQLSQVVQTAAGAASKLRKTEKFSYTVNSGVTAYLDAAQCEIRLLRHSLPTVEITAHLQMPFAWRIGAEQDADGVYFTAQRKPVVGAIAEAYFEVLVPHDAHVVVKGTRTRVVLENASGLFEFAPQITVKSGTPRLTNGN